ncbi:MAG: Uma2 family endonuclease [Cytophagales bacterium]|nr:Uma2 family endonuclease [Cytophagales bacterium]
MVMEKTLTQNRIYTYDDLNYFLPNGNYEIIDGKKVNMSPTGFIHGEFEFNIARFLKDHLENKGYVSVGEIGIVISKKPFRLRAADVVYISKETSASKPEGILEIAPDLIFEILSKDDTIQDMNDKIKDYLSIGVKKIVVVDPFTKSLSIYHQNKKDINFYNFDQQFELIDGIKVITNKII